MTDHQPETTPQAMPETTHARQAFVIGGTCSGTGKTSVTLGLCRAFSHMGKTVQPFKVGPDYIDPAFLTQAAGRTTFNLDGWMMGLPYCHQSFAAQTEAADTAIVEGVMGLYDGADADSLAGSTAEMAIALNLPVVLVVDASSMGRSVAAVVKGFCELEPDVRVCGVIANRLGSDRHAELVRDALESAGLPPLIGAIKRGAFPTLASRHLGLVQATEAGDLETILNAMADACEQAIDFSLLQKLTVRDEPSDFASLKTTATKMIARIGIAKDEAFQFYYPDNLRALKNAGAELVEFSPLHDSELPDRLDAIYFGGGYPEVFAKQLSENKAIRTQIHLFAASGKRIYAECGGFMYLADHVIDSDANRHEMCGVIPVAIAMCEKRKRLGFAEVHLCAPGPWGNAGTTLRGHEFHYSEISHWLSSPPWQTIYDVNYRRQSEPTPEGYFSENILAGYVHLHWAAHPESTAAFVRWCAAADR